MTTWPLNSDWEFYKNTYAEGLLGLKIAYALGAAAQDITQCQVLARYLIYISENNKYKLIVTII